MKGSWASYVSVASGKAGTKVPIEPVTLHSIMVTDKGDEISGEEVLKQILFKKK